LLLSIAVFVHEPPHMLPPLGQPHAPPLQVWPPGHTTPTHARCTHALPKHTESGSHVCPVQLLAMHWPAAHACPLGHTVPQAPQLAESVWKFAHAPAHAVWPGAQAQTPCEHANPAPHTTPTHDLSTHAFCEHTWSGPHIVAPQALGKHAPLPQPSPEAHDLPQLPQFASSVSVATQLEPQALLPVGQVVPEGGVELQAATNAARTKTRSERM
jgi:hypothetical protein